MEQEESACDSLQTEVGFVGTDTQTEVVSTCGIKEGECVGDESGGDSSEEDASLSDIWDEELLMEQFLESRKSRNLAVAHYFEKALDSPYRSEWHGKNGTISHICEVFNF